MVRHSDDDNGEDASTPYFRLVNKESSKSLESRIIDPITIGYQSSNIYSINPAISQPTGQTLKAISAKTITRIINNESSKSSENRIIDPITIGYQSSNISTINPAISQPTGQTLKAISAKTITRIINNESSKSSENRIKVPSIEGKQNLFGIDSIQNKKKDVQFKDKKGLFKDGINCIKDLLKKPFIKNLKLSVNFFVIFFYLT